MLQFYSALKSYTHLKVAAWGDLQGSLYWSHFSSSVCVLHLALYPQRILGFLVYVIACLSSLLAVNSVKVQNMAVSSNLNLAQCPTHSRCLINICE